MTRRGAKSPNVGPVPQGGAGMAGGSSGFPFQMTSAPSSAIRLPLNGFLGKFPSLLWSRCVVRAQLLQDDAETPIHLTIQGVEARYGE